MWNTVYEAKLFFYITLCKSSKVKNGNAISFAASRVETSKGAFATTN
jgi:hypothetical protein